MNNNSSRTHLPWMFNNSLAIRQEIQRFESVHPSIYAIYHLIDLIPDVQVAQQIRDHVVCIEGKEREEFSAGSGSGPDYATCENVVNEFGRFKLGNNCPIMYKLILKV